MIAMIDDSDAAIGREIVNRARAYLGTPWLHQGRDMNGIDCVGLLVVVAAAMGGAPPDLRNYRRIPDTNALTLILKSHCDELVRGHPGFPGAVLEIFHRGAPHPMHVGIQTDKGIIHACARSRGVVEHAIDRELARRIVRRYVWRPNNV